jgi:hypothetical protein
MTMFLHFETMKVLRLQHCKTIKFLNLIVKYPNIGM